MASSAGESMRSELAVAAAISLVIHLIVGVGVFGRMSASHDSRPSGGDPPLAPDVIPPEEPAEQKRPRLRLGIEQSSHASVTWLGFDTPEEHQVTQESKVEQAALARTDVSGMEAGAPEAMGQEPVASALPTATPAPASPESPPLAVAPPAQSPAVETVPERASQTADAQTNQGIEAILPPTPVTSLPSPAVVTVPATSPLTEGPARDEELTLTDKIGPKPPQESEEAEKPIDTPATPDARPEPASGEHSTGAPPEPAEVPGATASPPSEPKPTSPTVQSTEPTPGPKPGASVGNADAPGEGDAVRVGIRSDKEAPASALKRALKYRPGRPVAVQGLELATVEPRWPVSVRLTSNPRNPVLVIHFDRKGVVTRADFLKDEKKGLVYNTGEPAVDEPLRTAIFQWRAKGEELLRIPADNPDATVSIVMEIVLNGR